MEVLLKGKAKYGSPPCTNYFWSAPIYIENIFLLYNKTSYLNEEVNRTEPSASVSVPWSGILVTKVFHQIQGTNFFENIWDT